MNTPRLSRIAELSTSVAVSSPLVFPTSSPSRIHSTLLSTPFKRGEINVGTKGELSKLLIENKQDAQTIIWGTNVSVPTVIKEFKEFVNNFQWSDSPCFYKDILKNVVCCLY